MSIKHTLPGTALCLLMTYPVLARSEPRSEPQSEPRSQPRSQPQPEPQSERRSQSQPQSVVLYGNLDLGLVKRSGSTTAIDRAYNNWLGVRGREALGDDVAATFVVEARFNPDTGMQERSGTLFQGETTVGLQSQRYGTVRLGRALTPLWHDIWKYEPWINSGFNASLAAYQTGSYTSDGVTDAARSYANFSRVENALFYQTPSLAGFNLHGAVGSERPAGSSANVASMVLNYAGGPLKAMAAYERNLADERSRVLAASLVLGPYRLMASHGWNSLRSGKERVAMVAATRQVGNGTWRAGYGNNRTMGTHKLSGGYLHALSKRTGLYADLYREYPQHRQHPQTGAGRITGVALGINHVF